VRSARLPLLAKSVINTIRSNKLIYLTEAKLNMLTGICLSNEIKIIQCVILEAGRALWISFILMASLTNKTSVYDVFGMIPPPSDKDGNDVQKRIDVIQSGGLKGIDGDHYYEYEIVGKKLCGLYKTYLVEREA